MKNQEILFLCAEVRFNKSHKNSEMPEKIKLLFDVKNENDNDKFEFYLK